MQTQFAKNMIRLLALMMLILMSHADLMEEQPPIINNNRAASDALSREQHAEDSFVFLQRAVQAQMLNASVIEKTKKVSDSPPCLELLQLTARQCRAEQIPFSITDHTLPFALRERINERDHVASTQINHSFPGLQVLSQEHQIYAVEDFISEDERKSLVASVPANSEHTSWGLIEEFTRKSQSCKQLVQEIDGDGEDSCRNFHYRNSFQSCANNKTLLDALNERISSLLPGLQSHYREPLVITRYATGGFYTEHQDGRRATILVHLSEEGAFTGGATFFRKVGLRVHGKPGLALVFFPNFGGSSGGSGEGEEYNPNLAHMAEEVESGEKLIGQVWIGITYSDTCKTEAQKKQELDEKIKKQIEDEKLFNRGWNRGRSSNTNSE